MAKNLDTTDRQMAAAHAAWALRTPGQAVQAMDPMVHLIDGGALPADVWSWGAQRITNHLRAMVYGLA